MGPKSGALKNRACDFPTARYNSSDVEITFLLRLAMVDQQNLREIIEQARHISVTPQQREAQGISFAYGNSSFENNAITRDTVLRAMEKLKSADNDESA